MKKIYAVFKDRTGTMKYYNNLIKLNIACKVVSTPKELGSKCGVSVIFSQKDLLKAKQCLKSANYPTFVNFYLIEILNNFKKFIKV